MQERVGVGAAPGRAGPDHSGFPPKGNCDAPGELRGNRLCAWEFLPDQRTLYGGDDGLTSHLLRAGLPANSPPPHDRSSGEGCCTYEDPDSAEKFGSHDVHLQARSRSTGLALSRERDCSAKRLTTSTLRTTAVHHGERELRSLYFPSVTISEKSAMEENSRRRTLSSPSRLARSFSSSTITITLSKKVSMARRSLEISISAGSVFFSVRNPFTQKATWEKNAARGFASFFFRGLALKGSATPFPFSAACRQH